MNFLNKIIHGDVINSLKKLPDDLVDCIITSPPYWGLRDYDIENQIGLEPTLEEYLNKLLKVTNELKRILKPTGILFWNHGNSYSGGGNPNTRFKAKDVKIPTIKDTSVKPKCLSMQNYRLVLKMIDQGWILRNIIIWHKPNHMPSSVKDRFTNAYEPVFMLVKNKKYWFDLEAVKEPYLSPTNRFCDKRGNYNGKYRIDDKKLGSPRARMQGTSLGRERKARPNPKGKNPGDVWHINTKPFPGSHFAVFPEKLVEKCILAGCPENGIVLDPFMGSGTTALIALKNNRNFIGVELNEKYIEIAYKRIKPYLEQNRLEVAS